MNFSEEKKKHPSAKLEPQPSWELPPKLIFTFKKRQCFTHPSESKSEGWNNTATLLADLIPTATKQPGQWFAQEVRWR